MIRNPKVNVKIHWATLYIILCICLEIKTVLELTIMPFILLPKNIEYKITIIIGINKIIMKINICTPEN